MSVSSSARDTCRILIACRTHGAITSCCESRCWRTMRRSAAIGVRCGSQPELLAEVDLARAAARRDVRGHARREHRALVQEVGAIADPERLAHVVVRDEHPDPALL